MIESPHDLFAAVRAALEAHYALERELGRGGMGVVYQATDRALDRRVAIKVAHPELTEHPTVAQRFLAEARMLARIRHPNIVAVHQAGRAGDLLYYVMDEVPGETLRQLLNREGALAIERARAITADLAAALHAAGEAGFVHRDVKPENVLIDRATGRALLADFGIARASGNQSIHPTPGQGIAVGTPAYMSPEQAAGETVDARSDLYGLGVVAYEMLAGQPPFVGPNRVVVSRHLSERPLPIERIRPDVPRAFARTVARALEKQPQDRWQTGEQFRRALAGERVGAAPRPLVRAAIAAALAAVIATGGARLLGRGGPPDGVNPRHSLLILPFDNLQHTRSLNWLTDGSVSMLGLTLAQWSDLSVVEHERLHDLMARHGLEPGDPIGLELARRLARDAGAWTVVRGEFSWAGDTLRLVARTYDVATGARVDVARVDARPGDDVRPLFDQLAARLLDLSGAPASAVGPGLAEVTTHSVEAFRHYLAGLDLLNRWDLAAARRELEAATAIDTTFSLAYYRLAHVLSWVGRSEDSLAHAALRRATRHMGRLAEADRIALSAYQAFHSMDFGTSRALYQRLLARNERDYEAWYGLGEAFFHDTTGSDRSGTLTRAYRAFRRALALDPGYALPYFHVNDLLRAASAARPPLLLLPGDSIADNGRAPAGRDVLAAAAARARLEWLAQARAWVVAQPGTKHAHVALLDAHVRLGDHSAALTEIERFRGSAGEDYPELPFDQATARFAAGEIDQAAEELARALDTLTAERFVRAEAAEEVVRAIAASANIYAYQGDLERARRVIALAGDVSRQLDSAMGVRLELPGELESWRMLGELYAAFGAPAPSLRRVWEAAAEAGRSAPAARRPAILASGGAAAVGLLAAAGGDTLAVTELRGLDGRPLAPEVDALLALSRRDSLAARQVIAGAPARPQRIAAGEGRYMVFHRPLAAQVLYALGDYAGALRALEGIDPGELEPRQFDMRWGILPRVHLLRALAHERQGDRGAAAREYQAVLTQWKGADPALHPVLAQAGRGLLRLGETTEQLAALGYQLTASMEGEGGCSVGPSPGERR